MGSDPDAVYKTGETDPAKIIVELCSLLYQQGLATGTAGGMSIRHGTSVWVAPSGVQKERMSPDDMFVFDTATQEYTRKPQLFKPSACTPLFLACHTLRDAGACIHTHSQTSVLVTLLWEKEFRISNVEQIKAIPRVVAPGNLDNHETMVIPIIDNKPHEDDLLEDLQKALASHPAAPAVLVKRHGIFVWGKDVWKAKVINESIEYLMELALRMRQLGLDV